VRTLTAPAGPPIFTNARPSGLCPTTLDAPNAISLPATPFFLMLILLTNRQSPHSDSLTQAVNMAVGRPNKLSFAGQKLAIR
jgi:hypothetical protein